MANKLVFDNVDSFMWEIDNIIDPGTVDGVVIGGRMCAGKSFLSRKIAAHMLKAHGIPVLLASFASKLKMSVASEDTLRGLLSDPSLGMSRDEIEEVIAKSLKMSRRRMLQYVGTDVVRKRDSDYWVRAAVELIGTRPEGALFTIDDWRFENEYLGGDGRVLHIAVIADAEVRALRGCGADAYRGHASEPSEDMLRRLADIVVINQDILGG